MPWHRQKRTDPVELHERRWQRLKGQRQNCQRGSMYSNGSQELVSKRGVTNSIACTEDAENAERRLLELPIRHRAGARWPGTCRWIGSIFRLLEPSMKGES